MPNILAMSELRRPVPSAAGGAIGTSAVLALYAFNGADGEEANIAFCDESREALQDVVLGLQRAAAAGECFSIHSLSVIGNDTVLGVCVRGGFHCAHKATAIGHLDVSWRVIGGSWRITKIKAGRCAKTRERAHG